MQQRPAFYAVGIGHCILSRYVSGRHVGGRYVGGRWRRWLFERACRQFRARVSHRSRFHSSRDEGANAGSGRQEPAARTRYA